VNTIIVFPIAGAFSVPPQRIAAWRHIAFVYAPNKSVSRLCQNAWKEWWLPSSVHILRPKDCCSHVNRLKDTTIRQNQRSLSYTTTSHVPLTPASSQRIFFLTLAPPLTLSILEFYLTFSGIVSVFSRRRWTVAALTCLIVLRQWSVALPPTDRCPYTVVCIKGR
jgi:hypothetical protein